MVAIIRMSLGRLILKPGVRMKCASTSEVVIFDSSEGWKATGPSWNQDFEPLTSEPKTITATSSPATRM